MENPFIIITGEQTYVPAQAIRVLNREELLARILKNDARIEIEKVVWK